MKRYLYVLLILALCLGLCACGSAGEDPELPETEDGAPQILIMPEIWPGSSQEGETPATPPPTPDTRPWHRVDITADNWSMYFQLREIPLYSISSSGVIAQVYQTYCVVLRDEYQDLVIGGGDYRVDFSFTFDVYYNTLDIDTTDYKYRHTDDFGYPGAPLKEATATKPAVFDCHALRPGAYGTDYSQHSGYSNAFFAGWANINMESKVWSGFYIDLDQVRLESVSGWLQIAD
jgi:hypothetical protein